MIGTTLSHYEIREQLGTGGMGEVYLAEDTNLNRRVALKILPAELAEDPERVERFEREAKAIASLNHPNIVTIYSVEEAEGLRFITMELVEGRTLTELIPEGGMPLNQFFEVALPLVDAIKSAHEKGITHRDLKPTNVMVSDEGRVKVLDFGLAKLMENGDAAERATQVGTSHGTGQLTEAGQILGTVAYMSPEQAEGRPTDHRSDIFSLGVLLYEMATGEAPFRGDTKISIITSILRDTPPSVTDVNRSLPNHLGRVINRSMAKDASRRFQTSTDLRNELEDLKLEFDTSEMRKSTLGLGPITRRKRRRLALAFGAAAAALVVVVLAGTALTYLLSRFQVTLGSGAGPSGGAAAPAAIVGARPSLAVLYFENLSGDESLDWMRTGLTDMLVTDLSQSPNLRVLGTDRLHQILMEIGQHDEPMTSFDTVEAVAREAEVENVLLGSFAMAGGRIRISARLQDAQTGEILTSESVEGQGEESIFGLVDDLTKRIKRQFDMPAATTVADVDKDLEEVSTDSLEAYRYYTEGLKLHESYKEQEAIPLLERAVELDPDFAMALAKLSVVHGNLGDLERAQEYAERAMQHVERLSDRERFYVEGRYYSLMPQMTEQAIEAYKKAVEKYPDHTAARHNLASELIKLDELEEAITHYEELMKSRSRAFPATPLQLAQAYGQRGEMERGYRVLRGYAEENPDNAAARANLANYLVWAGRFEEALDELDAAESLQPGNMEAAVLRIMIDVLTEDYARAASRAQELVDTSNSPRWKFQGVAIRGLTELYRGRSQEAREALAELQQIAPESTLLRSQARLIAANVLLELGEPERALQAAREAVEEARGTPNLPSAIGFLALAQAAVGDEEAAEETIVELQSAGQMVPRPVMERQEQIFRGLFALELGDHETAIEELERAHAMLPPRPSLDDDSHILVWYSLGIAHFEEQEGEEALEWFDRLAESRERVWTPVAYVRSLFYLGQIYEDLDDEETAAFYYRRFLDHWGRGDIDRERVEAARAFLE